jgi:hypothetical protein
MAVRGRKVDIDLEELEKLCMMQATDEELAGFFGVTTRTIERRRQDPQIAAIMERGKAKGKLTVRRHQFRILEQGNASMGIWLGKQVLGQSEYHANAAPRVVISLGAATGLQPSLHDAALLRDIGEPEAEN